MADNSTDLAALAYTPEGRAALRQAVDGARVAEAKAGLDLFGSAPSKSLVTSLTALVNATVDPEIKTFYTNVLFSISTHVEALQRIVPAA